MEYYFWNQARPSTNLYYPEAAHTDTEQKVWLDIITNFVGLISTPQTQTKPIAAQFEL